VRIVRALEPTRKPVSVLQHGTTVADIVNLAAITAVVGDRSGGPLAERGELVGPLTANGL
jgi:antitoxin (DNA-binding transcriptional repressor) of toxin-antitoxin stability system